MYEFPSVLIFLSEDLVQDQRQSIGGHGRCQLGEPHHVRDQHRHVRKAVCRHVGTRLQSLGNGVGRHVERQPLRDLALRHDLIEQLLELVILAADQLAAGLQFLHGLLECFGVQADFQHVVDARHHLGEIEWLGDEIFRSGPERAQLVIRLGGDHEHRQVAALFDFLEAFHHLESVHGGHLEVEQDQVVAILAVKLAHRAWIERGCHRKISCSAQHALEQKDIGFLIVDDQDLGVENTG